MNLVLFALLCLGFAFLVGVLSFKAGKRSESAKIEAAYALGRKDALLNKGDLIRKAYRIGVIRGSSESSRVPLETKEDF
jgi:hypothetical protein